MTTQPSDPKRLCSVPSEAEAAMLVSQLDAAGIEAWTEGGPSTQYRAEAPGMAHVLVPAADLERAARIVAESSPPPRHRATGDGPAPAPSSTKVLWAIVAVVLIVLIVLGYVTL